MMNKPSLAETRVSSGFPMKFSITMVIFTLILSLISMGCASEKQEITGDSGADRLKGGPPAPGSMRPANAPKAP